MKVIGARTFSQFEAAIKFTVDAFEVSLATDFGRPSIAVYSARSPRPVYQADVSGDEEIIDLLMEVKNRIKDGTIS